MKSLLITITVSQLGTIPKIARVTKLVVRSNLSAMGSK